MIYKNFFVQSLVKYLILSHLYDKPQRQLTLITSKANVIPVSPLNMPIPAREMHRLPGASATELLVTYSRA